MKKNNNTWALLDYSQCRNTMDTLHMKMQIVGKVKLALTPFLNHWWNVAFYLNSKGMTTGLIPYGDIAFEIMFDFFEHKVIISTDVNREKIIPLEPGSVAGFYGEFMSLLKNLGIKVSIDTLPAEVPDPVRCTEDDRSTYIGSYVTDWWKILVKSKTVFEIFRSPFRGKSSPVQFFWGSFDLNYARFSGRSVNPPNYGGRIMRFAENEENFSCGFWHGSLSYPKPAFYAYIYPALPELENLKLKTQAGSYNTQLGEFILDYDEIVKSDEPENKILDFMNSAYEICAEKAGWDIETLKAEIPN